VRAAGFGCSAAAVSTTRNTTLPVVWPDSTYRGGFDDVAELVRAVDHGSVHARVDELLDKGMSPLRYLPMPSLARRLPTNRVTRARSGTWYMNPGSIET
jgi:hypothetical protein